MSLDELQYHAEIITKELLLVSLHQGCDISLSSDDKERIEIVLKNLLNPNAKAA